ncbi:MAG: tRNA (N(6)-L-threonylcarbamoyladenosine(37)-C(2))-methylthiotransferase MtaB [Planctomycetota bacterium]|nr:MAG: tRNA (N(6)-L-threonylcarbamoyladenosine(37)-C(2))-methylthiotransferase MtaB [Planctomycetota bacterium]RKY13636.1 MAG: tRNA (N(6)-L-threonylcarbamoyladenosine(37)-C(2))-methylthiotransferase MtaB [Planctomycetota bacterium]
MKTFAVQTLGCKVNQYESQQIRQILEQFGLTAAEPAQQPDLVVVNTCCVTHTASSKSRQSIRKVQKAHPRSTVIVTGCLPAGPDNEAKTPDSDIIVRDKRTLPLILEQLSKKQPFSLNNANHSKPRNHSKIKDKNPNLTHPSAQKHLKNISTSADSLPVLTRFAGQTRAFLKVQDGCDAYCTYCIIPKIRMVICNKPVKTVLKEAKNLIRAGHKEIILTGIFLGAYDQKTARRKKWNPAKLDSLAELVDKIADLENMERLRLSSLEPLDVTDRLLEVMNTRDNIAPHLHLSLQSGSPNILKKMARQYTIDDFLRVVEKVKKAFDRPAITTDIIVGFPGETDEDFQQTIKIAKQVGFSKIHTFSFSVRKNTPAEKMAKLFGTISPQEIKRRSSALQAVDAELQDQYRQSCAGITEQILIEKTNPPRGRGGRYFMVDLSDTPEAKTLQNGQLINLTL